MTRLLLAFFCAIILPIFAGAEDAPAPPDITIAITGPATDFTKPENPPHLAAITDEGQRVPQIDSLVPTAVDSCSLQQGRIITVRGEFPAEVRVLLDGAAIPAKPGNSGELMFALPPLAGGIHLVQLAEPNGRRSLPQALLVDSSPKITAVHMGKDQVTAYEMIIRGENFFFGSALVVDGNLITSPADHAALLGGQDFLRYIDCTTLLYIRHPVTREPNEFTLRVLNADGQQSAPFPTSFP
ncbi:MAG: hypothetical protein WDA20_11880 [Desulfuromonadales bacterium]